MAAVKERIIQMKSGHVRKTTINALESLSISLPVKSDTQAGYMLPGLSWKYAGGSGREKGAEFHRERMFLSLCGKAAAMIW